MVVDASAVVDDLIAGHSLTGPLIAPDVLFVECSSAFARLVRHGTLDSAHADDAIAMLAELPLTVVSTRALTTLAWSLRASVSISDAYYVACAVVTGGTLRTTDRRLARAAQVVGVPVQS